VAAGPTPVPGVPVATAVVPGVARLGVPPTIWGCPVPGCRLVLGCRLVPGCRLGAPHRVVARRRVVTGGG
jgi:hypothetical protein